MVKAREDVAHQIIDLIKNGASLEINNLALIIGTRHEFEIYRVDLGGYTLPEPIFGGSFEECLNYLRRSTLDISPSL